MQKARLQIERNSLQESDPTLFAHTIYVVRMAPSRQEPVFSPDSAFFDHLVQGKSAIIQRNPVRVELGPIGRLDADGLANSVGDRTKFDLTLPKLLFSTLALRYIDHGTHELSQIAGSIKDRTADCVNVPDSFFRMNDPVVPFEIRFVAYAFLKSFPARRLIVRMKSLKQFLESRWRASVIEPQHMAAHLRAVSDITGRGIPCPTASLAESLRFRQIGFTFHVASAPPVCAQ